jgi:predicted RND superfamily exporter protein
VKAAPDRSRLYPLFARYVAYAERRTMLLLCLLLLVGAGALEMALRLELHTDMAELLPDQHPAVLALRRIAGRQKSATNLVMLVHSPDEQANQRFAEAVRGELERMIPETFTEIQWRPETEVADYAAKWKWLYADEADLDRAEGLLDRVIAGRSSPLAVDIDGDPEAELRELRQKLNQKLPPRRDAPYFQGKDGSEWYLGVMMWRRRDGLATRGDHDTLRAVQAIVAHAQPTRFHPRMVVEYTGHIAQAIDEQNGIRDDLTVATLVCSSLVLLAIWLYFRRWALIFVIGAPAVLGLLCALLLASVTIHYLNINTAFLISIILGNGINSPIVLLARYGEERAKRVPVARALAIAMSQSFLGTLTAMMAASIAYGSLLVTSFRGFNQFGLLGGAGMLLVWIMTFLLVPPMVIYGERRWPGRLTPRPSLFAAPFRFIGRLCARQPVLLAVATVVLVGAAAGGVRRYVHDPLEWDFNNLRTDETPSQRLWNRMELLGMGDVGAGYIGNNGVLLVDHASQADAVAEALRVQDAEKGPAHVLKEVRTFHSMLPRAQGAKLEQLARIRAKIDRHNALLDDKELAELDAWRPPDYLRRLTLFDLPRQVREAFTEVDGHQGRLIGIDADHATYYDWNGHDLLRMSKALTVDALGHRWTAASAATIFAGMLETIIADGPRVTLVALCGVALFVFGAFGLRGAPPVLASLCIGIFWLGGLLAHEQLKINFMNFVALPITLGVGADYAANIWARLRAEGLGCLERVITETGSAVALCSLTTIIGYSSLLMSHNRALRSFGLCADLGEVTCLAAALVAMPALLQLLHRRSRGDKEERAT